MQSFWLEFWPSFAATVLGVVIGIPCALWTNRWIVSVAERKRLAIDDAERNALVETILGALKETGAGLTEVRNLSPGNRTGPRLLDSGTWDALKRRLQRNLGPPDLIRRLAFYWLQLCRFNQFHRNILELKIRGELRGDPQVVSCNSRKSWARDLAYAARLYSDLAAIHK